MSTFYVLPPRSVLADRLADFLTGLLPGLDWTRIAPTEVSDWLSTATSRLTDVYVVHREDLPAGEPVRRALADGFGAEAGDEVVEVRVGLGAADLTTRRYRLET